jgi:Glycosyl hydrolases family 16
LLRRSSDYGHVVFVAADTRRNRRALALAVLAVCGLGTPAGVGIARADDMPVGDVPGWHQIFTDDFSTPAAPGQFPGSVYASRWAVYPDGTPDTTRRAVQAPSRILSVSDGALHWEFGPNGSGTPQVADPLPKLAGDNPYHGVTYGRFSVRFRATSEAAGYTMVFLLWPDDDHWPFEGEVDFPTAELTGPIGFTDIPAAPTVVRRTVRSAATMQSWHVATLEWSPGLLRFLIDDQLVGTQTDAVPSTPMHWVLQTDTTENGPPPAAGARAELEVDWVAAWTYAPGTGNAGTTGGPAVSAPASRPATTRTPLGPRPHRLVRIRPGACRRDAGTTVAATVRLVFPPGARRRRATLGNRRVRTIGAVSTAGVVKPTRIAASYVIHRRRRHGCAWIVTAA